MKTRFINLTKHPINIVGRKGQIETVEPDGTIARVTSVQKRVGQVNGYPIYRSYLGEIINLPEPIEGVTFITSMIVASFANREDVVSPNTAPHSAVRDGDGKVIGVKGFQTFGSGYNDESDPEDQESNPPGKT